MERSIKHNWLNGRTCSYLWWRDAFHDHNVLGTQCMSAQQYDWMCLFLYNIYILYLTLFTNYRTQLMFCVFYTPFHDCIISSTNNTIHSPTYYNLSHKCYFNCNDAYVVFWGNLFTSAPGSEVESQVGCVNIDSAQIYLKQNWYLGKQ